MPPLEYLLDSFFGTTQNLDVPMLSVPLIMVTRSYRKNGDTQPAILKKVDKDALAPKHFLHAL